MLLELGHLQLGYIAAFFHGLAQSQKAFQFLDVEKIYLHLRSLEQRAQITGHRRCERDLQGINAGAARSNRWTGITHGGYWRDNPRK